ncbi:PadR family transcriptional regulator [Lentzea tibetensis]|nr:PadR family transcriptional regulator [Lentzea tibetensis]
MRAAVLHLLAERPMHGYEMIQEIARRTDGQWTPSPGSIYPTLQMLADEGFVTSTEEGGKKLFSLTDIGTTEGEAAPWDVLSFQLDPVDGELRSAVRLLGSAMEQISHAGTSAQKARAAQLYNELRRKLYSILSEES